MSHNTAIIDYDAGNLDSVKRAVEECGGNPFIAQASASLKEASFIILPGVGSFFEGMRKLREKGFDKALSNVVGKIPILGICLGMQLLASNGTEGGEKEGLGFIKGKVIRLEKKSDERIPHIGWNEVILKKECPIFNNIDTGRDFYFVHSYHFVPSNKDDIAAITPYCGEFVSAVRNGNVFGVQFHPEKSQKAGFRLLKNFLEIC